MSVKSAVRAIKFIVGILARVFVRNSMCLKSIVNSFVIAYDETINGRDSAATISFDHKEYKIIRFKMDFFLHICLLMTILPAMITINCYHYEKFGSKQKNISTRASCM